ncbi:MAG TPA: response regulator [Candidatus Dormibacteraeota bacterium]|nr:response regulator [Candidatus Dormibacteraeota bacterium]
MGTVYVVDDDAELREYLCWVLQGAGWRTVAHGDATAFLAAYRDDGPACVVSDLYMPGMSGLELQGELTRRGHALPMIMISAQGEVKTAVQAMREGAVDFLEKPFAPEQLLKRVEACMARVSAGRADAAERRCVQARFAKLTPRQRAVLDGLIAGKPSKVIASELGLSPRTVDVHRFRIMHQLEADSLPDLFRMVVLLRGAT